MTLIGDVLPSGAVATVVGLSGTAGGLGGFLSSLTVGRVIQVASLAPVFTVCGLLYPVGLAIILLTVSEKEVSRYSRMGAEWRWSRRKSPWVVPPGE